MKIYGGYATAIKDGFHYGCAFTFNAANLYEAREYAQRFCESEVYRFSSGYTQQKSGCSEVTQDQIKAAGYEKC